MDAEWTQTHLWRLRFAPDIRQYSLWLLWFSDLTFFFKQPWSVFFLKIFIYLFGCTGSLVAAYGTFSCDMWDLVPEPGIERRPPALGAQSLSHWTTREVPPDLTLNIEENGIPEAYLSMDSFLTVHLSSVYIFWSTCFVVSIFPNTGTTVLNKFLAFKQLVV